MGSAPMLPGSGTSQWWKDPEKRTAAFFYAAAAVGAFFLWGLIAPFVIEALNDFWQMMKLAALIVVSVTLLTSKRVHVFARVINRWVTSWFVSLDPIGIREDQIEQTEKRKSESDKATGSFRGLMRGLTERLDFNCNEYRECMLRMKAAKSILANSSASAEARHQAERKMSKDAPYSDDLQKIITAQQAQMKHYNEGLLKLTRFGEICDDFIERRKREIRLQRDNQAEAQSLKVVRQAMGAIFGKAGDIGSQMDAMAKTRLDREYQDEIGQFDQFVSIMSDSVATADFNDLAALQDVQSKLDKFDALRGATPQPKQILSAPIGIALPQPKQAVPVKDDYFK